MKYIKNLKLKNFEGWVDGNIDFKNGFNVIMGDSDSGKSSIFRAIETVLTGKCGQENVNKNAKDLKVELTLSDGSLFTREYGKKGNKISYNDVKFERIGREVPTEYLDFLGNTFVKIDDNKKFNLCLYSQFDSHFFINFSDYDKSKLIGAVCGIGSIDKLVDLINRDIRDNNSKVKFLNEQLKENEEKYSLLSEEYNKEKKNNEKLNKVFNKLKKNCSIYEEINKLSDNYNTLCNEQKLKESLLNKNLFTFDFEKYNQILGFFVDLLKLTVKELNKKDTIKNNKRFFDSFIDYREFEKLVFLYNEFNKLHKNESNLLSLKEKNQKQIGVLEIASKELLKKFDKCPLCGGVIKK